MTVIGTHIVCKAQRLYGDIKIAKTFHHVVPAKSSYSYIYRINQICYTIWYQNHYKLISLFVTKAVEQPTCETLVHNVVVIREGRHANVNKQISCTPDKNILYLSWDRNSYLTQAVTRKMYIGCVYWNSSSLSSTDVIVMLKWRHHNMLHLSVFRNFW